MTALNDLLQQATRAEQAGRTQEAERLWERVVALDPAHPPALNSLGMRALARADHARAAELFARAAAADARAPALWMNLATATRAQGDAEAERAALTGALEADQRHLMALIRLAELHERLGELPQATMRWSAVLQLIGDVPDLPPALAPVLAHARAFTAERNALFAGAIDAALSTTRAAVPPSERRRSEAALDAMFGRRQIYRNECHGLFVPFLPADEWFDRAHFPWFDRLEAEADAIRDEYLALADQGLPDFTPYVAMDPGTPDNKWSALDHSPAWNSYHLWRHGQRDETAAARAPRTAAILDTLPLARLEGRAPAAFFSVLAPRTRIPPHTGVTNARAIVHLALTIPPGCALRVGGETREWEPGRAFAFDDTIEHEAWNDSDRHRAVLIFDTWNPHLSDGDRVLIEAFFTAARTSGHDPSAGQPD